MYTYKDQLNRDVQLKGFPERIVSLVPSITELIVNLGLEYALVGVTKFCVHPAHIRKTASVVGGTKQVRIQGILELKPDLILCNKEENTLEMVQELSTIAPVHVSDVETFMDAMGLIANYSEIFGCEDEGYRLMSKIINEEEDLKSWLKGQPKPKVAYFIWKNPYMVSAAGTFINAMIESAGFINVFKDEKRYPEIDLNHPKLKEADCIFLSSEPYPFKPKDIELFQNKFPEKAIRIVDGELFSWYGSRMLRAFSYFKTLHKKKSI